MWLYDANVCYLGAKHILLLATVDHIIPDVLLMGQQCKTETFHGFLSYKAKHILAWGAALALLIFFFYLLKLPSNLILNKIQVLITLLEILVAIGNLQSWAWVSGGVYQNWCLDGLESSFALNLIILDRAPTMSNLQKKISLQLDTPLSQ